MHELGKVDDSVSILGAQRRESVRRHHTGQGRQSEDEEIVLQVD